MRKTLTPLCLLLCAAFVFVSCLKSDRDEVVLYDDCAITAFGVSTAPLVKHTTSSKGEDSTYIANGNSMTAYKFVINHEKGLIYNPDSLPINVVASKLICTYNTPNNGIVYIKHPENDSLKYFSTADSTDFTMERVLQVFSSDGTATRKYTVKVNVHQQEADEFVWQSQKASADVAAMEQLKGFLLGEKIVVAGRKSGVTCLYSRKASEDTVWTAVQKTFGADALKSIAVFGDSIVVLDGQTLYASADGENFEERAQVDGVSRLAGACATEIYALSNEGMLMVSTDGGRSWTDDVIDDDRSMLPSADIACTCYEFYEFWMGEYVMLVGNRDVATYPNDGGAIVWRKIVSPDDECKWAYMDGVEKESYMLPRLSGLGLFYYDNSVMAYGGEPIDGSTTKPYSCFYQSRDGGITWKPNTLYTFPKEFNADATSVAVVTDKDNFIHLIAGGTGEVWKGRLNRLGWDTDNE